MRDEHGRFVKGHPGASRGRPKVERIYSEALRALGHEIRDGQTVTRNEEGASALWKLALDCPDPKVQIMALKEIGDRTEGRPAQKIDVTTDGQGLIKGYPSGLLDKVQ